MKTVSESPDACTLCFEVDRAQARFDGKMFPGVVIRRVVGKSSRSGQLELGACFPIMAQLGHDLDTSEPVALAIPHQVAELLDLDADEFCNVILEDAKLHGSKFATGTLWPEFGAIAYNLTDLLSRGFMMQRVYDRIVYRFVSDVPSGEGNQDSV